MTPNIRIFFSQTHSQKWLKYLDCNIREEKRYSSGIKWNREFSFKIANN